MQHFDNASAGDIVLSISDRIIENRAYLSEIDGKIGDGDHGVNMAKGFGMAADRIRGNDMSLASAFDTLGTVLMTEIGGSMGPLYGIMFTQFAETIENSSSIGAETFSTMLTNGPRASRPSGRPRWTRRFSIRSSRPSRPSTAPTLAASHSRSSRCDGCRGRKGPRQAPGSCGEDRRASRLGERSLGVLDAGATSCALILKALALGAKQKLRCPRPAIEFRYALPEWLPADLPAGSGCNPARLRVRPFALILQDRFWIWETRQAIVKAPSARKNGAARAVADTVAEPIPLRYGDDPYVWACWLCYEDRMTQGDIADIMGISRATVNSYVAGARAREIVNISLEPSRLSSLSIAQELKRHFGLHDCLVVPSDDNARPLIDRLGGAAAQALAKLLKSGDTLAVAWEELCWQWEQASVPGLQDVTVVQATGGTRASFAYTPELCAAAIANAVDGKLINITAPAVVSTAEVRDMLLREPLIESQFAALAKANKALFGISSLRPNSTIHTSGFFESVSLQQYLAKDAVGVVAGRFIDGQGNPVAGPLDDRTIGISLDRLKAIGLRIAVAGGFDKVPAILAALRGGYVNVLITDAATGRGILNADGVTELDQKLSQRPRLGNTAALPSNFRTHIKKFLNDPDDVVEEMFDGVVKAHAAYIEPIKGSHRASLPAPGQGPGKSGW